MAQKVQFTQQQVEYMERMYPELVGSAATPEAELRFRAGQRSVIHFMRSNVQQTQNRSADGLAE